MSILLTKETRAIVQGITGRMAEIQLRWMKEYGTNLVGGVTPGKGGTYVNGVPVFDSVAEAVEKCGANASVIFIPAQYAKTATLEAIDAKLDLVVMIPEHVAVKDVMEIKQRAQLKGVWVIGPNTPGIISPGIGKLGIMPANMFRPGRIGMISRSGTLAYEVAGYLNEAGFGQSTLVGLGGDPVTASSLASLLAEFDQDSDTDAVVIVGEIGGSAEENASETIKKISKPVIAYFAGKTAPQDKKMGHAGAIIKSGQGTVEAKAAALSAASALVAQRISDIPGLVQKALR